MDYVKIVVPNSNRNYSIIKALGYENRLRIGLRGGYVVTVERDDAPAFIALLTESG